MPWPKLPPIEKHSRPFKVSHLELNPRMLMSSLGQKSSRGQALDGVAEGELSPLLLQGNEGGQEEG